MAHSFPWVKGHGTRNDFVLLPDPDGSVHGDLDPALVRWLCDRRGGIGGDGVIRVIRSAAYAPGQAQAGAAEWFMDYRNADGSPSQMCGNGIRVFARHLVQEGLVKPDEPIRIGTRGGTRTVQLDGGRSTVDMGAAQLLGATEITVGDRRWPATRVSIGNPHAVTFVRDLAEAGPLLDPPGHDAGHFPDGVNVEFVRVVGIGHIAMRVHERGSGETRSCGTGACAAAVAAIVQAGWQVPSQVRVDVPGGTLHVGWHADGRAELTGPAAIVTRGEWLGQ